MAKGGKQKKRDRDRSTPMYSCPSSCMSSLSLLSFCKSYLFGEANKIK